MINIDDFPYFCFANDRGPGTPKWNLRFIVVQVGDHFMIVAGVEPVEHERVREDLDRSLRRSLPGRILLGFAALYEKLIIICSWAILNFVGFFFLKKVNPTASGASDLFVNYDENQSKSIFAWPIWVIIGFVIMFGAPSATTYYSSNASNILQAFLAAKDTLGVLWVLILFFVFLGGLAFPIMDIIKSIFNILKAILLRMCLIREIPNQKNLLPAATD